jgi:hypothetical protein
MAKGWGRGADRVGGPERAADPRKSRGISNIRNTGLTDLYLKKLPPEQTVEPSTRSS